MLDSYDNMRNIWVADYKYLREKGLQQQLALRSTAMSAFTINGGRGTQERTRYSTELDIWYRTQMDDIDSELSNCIRDIRQLDAPLSILGGVFEAMLSSTGFQLPTISAPPMAPNSRSVKRDN